MSLAYFCISLVVIDLKGANDLIEYLWEVQAIYKALDRPTAGPWSPKTQLGCDSAHLLPTH